MASIEGFRVQNFRALRDITLGKVSYGQNATALTPFTVVIGKNGAAKARFLMLSASSPTASLPMWKPPAT